MDSKKLDKPMTNAQAKAKALSADKRALLQRLRGAQGPRTLAESPVAVVGYACLLPGAPDADAFWDLLVAGRDAVGPPPPGREQVAWDPREAPALAGFLPAVDRFDAAFFGISPREARTLDPQHRLLLQTAWHAVEHAELTRAALRGTSTGVFCSVYQRDYARLALQDPAAVDAYTTSGTHHSIAANRLSYLFDLRGPSLTVDTACSSSLVATHLACRSLLRGECDRAIVGASNLLLAPEPRGRSIGSSVLA